MTYEVHPLADAMPALRKQDYQELLADVQTNGLVDPITLFDGKVLDGRNRLRACQEAGIEPRFVEYTGNDPAAFVIAKNIKRRHLSPSQRAMAVAKMSDIVAQLRAQAQDRSLNNLKKGTSSPIPSPDGIGEENAKNEEVDKAIDSEEAEPAQPHNKHDNTTAAKLGKKADVSEKSVERAQYVHDHGTSDDVKEVESGEKSVSRKAKEIRERREKKNSENQTRDGEPGPEQKEHHPEAEAALIRKEWKTCIETLKHTLLLAGSAPPVELGGTGAVRRPTLPLGSGANIDIFASVSERVILGHLPVSACAGTATGTN
jgi:ParB-like chromosome segregation protein Spo0J